MPFQDRLAEEAFTQVAGLLAAAYQRYVEARPTAPEGPEEPPANELDKSCTSSLHGQ